MTHSYSAYVLQVAARKDDDDDPLPNGGMVLDLTAELGTPPLLETNDVSTSCHFDGQLPEQECHWAEARDIHLLREATPLPVWRTDGHTMVLY
jgi:hypothetical protein